MQAVPLTRLLAVDVGNSRIKFGLFAPAAVADTGLPQCLETRIVPLNDPDAWMVATKWLQRHAASDAQAIVAGANPPGIERLLNHWGRTGWAMPMLVEDPARLPLVVRVPEPQNVGIDRLLNAVAANRLRETGHPAVIVSSGTATTVDLLDREGHFLGGVILPGFQLSATALHDHTALLPLVSVQELAGDPPVVLGTNTRDAIRSGLFWGQVGGIKELVRRLGEFVGQEPLTVVTGGGGELLLPHLENGVSYQPHLPLHGLALLL